MSGGSFDYAFCKVEDMANQLVKSKKKEHRVFGKHLLKVAKAMHDIEWVESCDYGDGQEMEAIKDCLSDFDKRLIEDSLERATRLMNELKEVCSKLEAEKNSLKPDA